MSILCTCGHDKQYHYHNFVAGTACRVKDCACQHFNDKLAAEAAQEVNRKASAPWKDWTGEQWTNAVFCPDCGLPMLETKILNGVGLYECPYCAWMDDQQVIEKALRSEREAAIKLLREICAEYGDNDWPDNLHLYDVIEKHLWRHLDPGDDWEA